MRKKSAVVRPTPDDIVFLKGKEVVLRPLSEQDIPFLMKWINDPDIRQYVTRYTPATEKVERDWLQGMGGRDARDIPLGINFNGKLIGTMGIHSINWKDRNAEIGIIIGDKNNQERGLGTDAAMTIMEYGFNTLNLHKLFWKAKDFNERSIKCALKCGLKEEARLKEYVLAHGKFHDEVILGVRRDEWLPVWEKYNKTK